MLNHFSGILQAPQDPILGLQAAFQKDIRKEKVNLSAGIYKNALLKTPILSCVKQAEELLLIEETSKSYFPIEGDSSYIQAVLEFLLGSTLYQHSLPCLSALQSVGGTGALRIGGEFLHLAKHDKIYISDPSWPNHRGIFQQCGLSVDTYPYYDFQKKELAFSEMMGYLSSIPKKSVVLFHVSCHNPSGADLSRLEWEEIGDLCQKNELIPFLDAAYLGFHSSFIEDAFPIRLFIEKKVEFLLSLSFSKNFCLYGERIGLFLAFSHENSASAIFSQLQILVRRNYSNPPRHGAEIVVKILETPSLRLLWEEELLGMKKRIESMRELLIRALDRQSPHKNYSPLLHKNGLFFYSGLVKEQVDRLIQHYAIYLPSDGRINIAGLSESNLSYVAEAISSVGG